MKKLIMSDFDETLINSDEEIPTSTVMVIDDLRRRGYKFAVATGRPLKSILDYNHDFLFIDYVVASNGSYIYDCVKEKKIYKKNLLYSNVKKIINNYFDKSIIYLINDITWNLISDKSAYEKDYDVIKVDDYKEFIEINKNNIYKMEVYFKTLDEAKKAISEINKLNLKINSILQLTGGKYLIEIVHEDVSKFNGAMILASKNKISTDDIIALGDGNNDYEIIKNVGIGVAVGNAVDEVKSVAKYITDDCNHKGVEKYLKTLLNEE